MSNFRIIWLTGLPASGKTTLANKLNSALRDRGIATHLLDGDAFRLTFSADLSYSPLDRSRNIKRVSDLLSCYANPDQSLTCICSFVSPSRQDRDMLRARFKESYFEVWCRCPVEICVQRDPKGLYKNALVGLVSNFTGVSAPYEEPILSDVVVDTDKHSVNECLAQILQAFFKHND